MRSRKLMIGWVLIIALLANVPAIAAMQGETEQPRTGQPGGQMERHERMGAEQRGGISALHRADEMIGKDVNGSDGQNIGDIEDLVLDVQNNRVSYVIISADNKLYPVPRNAFMMKAGEKEKAKECTLNMTKDQLKQSPAYDNIEQADLNNASWRQRIDQYYRGQGMMQEGGMQPGTEYQRRSMPGQERQPGLSEGSQPGQTGTGAQERPTGQTGAYQRQPGQAGYERRGEMGYESDEEMAMGQGTRYIMASDVIGLNVRGSDKEDLAEVEDILIDSKTGYLAYALVSFGGALGVGEKTAAVPWAALDVHRGLEYATLNVQASALEQAVVAEGDIARLSEATYARRIHEQFNEEPYWEVYGFVPGMAMSMDAWKPDSSYTRNFDPQNIQTIDGKITSVGTFSPEEGAAPGLRLKVQTGDGKTMTVHAGPKGYASQQDIKFKVGSDVNVKGSQAQIGERSVIIASEISSEGKTLKLRDEQGKPLWNVESLQQKMQQKSMQKGEGQKSDIKKSEGQKGTY